MENNVQVLQMLNTGLPYDTPQHTHNGVWFNHEWEGIPAICNDMDVPWGHYAKWDKSKKNKYCMIPIIFDAESKTC